MALSYHDEQGGNFTDLLKFIQQLIYLRREPKGDP